MINRKEKKDKVGAKNMFMWQSRAISLGANLMVLGFLSIYCTNTLGIPAAVVGILLVLSKIVDGFTDIFAGVLVDRTNTKLGRGRPYEVCIIGVWVCTWLMFTCPPQFSMAVKCIWVFAMYIMITSIFTTFLNANNTVYLVRAFAKQEHYVAISTYGSIITMLFVVMVNVTLPMAVENIATSASGWSKAILIYAIPMTMIGLLRLIFIKETNKVDVEREEKVRIKDVLLVLRTNKYIYAICIVSFIFNVVTNMGIGQYYFTYIVKDLGLMGIMGLMQIVILPLVFIFPQFIKKFSVTKLMLVGVILVMAGYLVNFIAYDSFPLLVVGALLTGAGNVPISMLLGLLIIDCAEFNEWKGNQRLEGTMSSISGFAAKVGSAVGAGAMGILLGLSGFVGTDVEIGAGALNMIRMLNSFIPMGLYVLVLLSLFGYKLDGKMPEIRKTNEERRGKVSFH